MYRSPSAGVKSRLAAEAASWIWLPWLVLAWVWLPASDQTIADVTGLNDDQAYDVIE